MMDDIFAFVFFGFVGLAIGVGLSGIPSGFQCTESAVVNGVAECIKYERIAENEQRQDT